VIAALLAALLAYVPSGASLIKRAGHRAAVGGKSKEISLSGTLTPRGEAPRPARLLLRFPFSCKLEGEAFSLAVKGTVEKPLDTAESSPAARLLQLACPFIAYRGLKPDEAEVALRAAALSLGVDLNAPPALSRLVDRVVYLLGAGNGSQLWLYKDSHAPARLIAQGNDLRLLQYGNPAAGEWFPRVIELWADGQLAAKFEVLEIRGFRAGEEEEYSRPE
jgi:hypothetical protein